MEMVNERLTLEEMDQKYPDERLFIVDCEYSENTELLSGCVLVHRPSRADVYDISSRYEGSAAIHCTGKLSQGMGYLLEWDISPLTLLLNQSSFASKSPAAIPMPLAIYL